MEWACELILGYRDGDARAQRLVGTTRTIVVPVVNSDGFNASREAGELRSGRAGRVRRPHERDVPRPGPVLGARDEERPRAHLLAQVTTLITNHTSSNLVLRPRASSPRG
jgi:hypothetical protein